MPERKVWRLYSMLLYEMEEKEKSAKRSEGKEILKPPGKY